MRSSAGAHRAVRLEAALLKRLKPAIRPGSILIDATVPLAAEQEQRRETSFNESLVLHPQRIRGSRTRIQGDAGVVSVVLERE
jgi:hypothetical protein